MFLKRHFLGKAQGRNVDCRLSKPSDLFSSSLITNKTPSTLDKCLLISNKWVMSWAEFMPNCWISCQVCCIWLVFFQWEIWWNLEYSKDWLVITLTVLVSHVVCYQVINFMPRVKTRSTQTDIWQGHCVGNITYLNMTLSCFHSQAPSCSALECCYQACMPLKTSPLIDELGW